MFDDGQVASLAPSTDSSASGPVPGAGSKSAADVMRSVWMQTAPLFSREHLLSTFLALFIMFGIIAGSVHVQALHSSLASLFTLFHKLLSCFL